MDKIILEVNLPPISLNNSHYKFSRRKTTDTKKWIKEFNNQIFRKCTELREFSQSYIPELHYVSVDYYFFIPKKKLITSGIGNITNRRNDRCNITKIPNDAISKIIGIDDGVFCDGVIKKLFSPDDKYRIMVILKLKAIDKLMLESTEHFDQLEIEGIINGN